ADEGALAWRHDPESGETTYTDASSTDFQFPEVPFDWPAPEAGDAVVLVGEPLDEATVLAGPGYVDLWVRSEVADVPVEVTLSEVTTDGTEHRIQGGWLRAGHRTLD